MLPSAQRHETERKDGEEEDRAEEGPGQKHDGADRAEQPDEQSVGGVQEAAAAVEEGVEHAGGDQPGDREQAHTSHDEVAQHVRSVLIFAWGRV